MDVTSKVTFCECPDRKNKESTRVIQVDSATPTLSAGTMAADPWIIVLTAMKEDDVDNNRVKLVGPKFECRCRS